MKNQNDILSLLLSTLKENQKYVINGKLNKTLLIDDAFTLKENLISTLLKNKDLKEYFFKKIKDVYIFDKTLFQQFVSNKQLLEDSFTKYKKDIGLNKKKPSTNFDDVILEWPFKDCVLEGGQTNEDETRNEIFWNSVLAKTEIDNLLKPKVLTNFKFFGEAKKENIKINNQVVFGNNLIALHSLKDVYAGKIQSIYCDPPYNTGKDSFGYNDKFTHSTWLTFFKNRIEVCKDLLKDSGSIWINLDDNEVHYAKVLLDEIFGRDNFLSNVIWEKKYSPSNDAKQFSNTHDHILVYAKNKNKVLFKGLARTNEANKLYKNPDNDPRGKWMSDNLTASRLTPKDVYEITTPQGRKCLPPQGSSWRVSKEKFEELLNDNRILFGQDGQGVPRLKRFLTEVKETITPKTIWRYNEVGHTQDASRELMMYHDKSELRTSKPEKLIKRILEISTNELDIVLDPFAGSGTTAAVAMKMKRKFITCEQMNYGNDIIINRLQKVIDEKDEDILKDIAWKGGGGFCCYDLKKLNIEIIEKIEKISNLNELELIIKDLQNHDYLSIHKNLNSLLLLIKKTKTENLEFAKQALVEVLDKSQLYLSYSELEDEKHEINKSDIEINKIFYQ